MAVYRRIYEKHKGPIPKDNYGKSYDIHHIDGNKKNNNINNLVALSLQEHYNIHYKQGDWGACLVISNRLKMNSEIRSELSKNTNLGKIRSEETKNKISQKNKGRIQTEEEKKYRSLISKGKSKGPMSEFQKSQISKSKYKKVYCNELKLTFISLQEASILLNINSRSIGNQILGRSKSVKYNQQKLTFKYL